MNRGRRRGGVSSGFGSLREGVKRRLFDPHTVPTLPDPRTIISRLTPLTTSQPHINSVFSIPDTQDFLNELSAVETFHNNLFETKATVDFIFDSSPSMQNLPKRTFDGISMSQRGSDYSKSPAVGRVGATHLLLKSCDISLWKDGLLLSSFSNPLVWYPKELADRVRSKTGVKCTTAKRAKPGSKPIEEKCDLDDVIISDRVLIADLDATEDDDDMVSKGVTEKNANKEDDGDKDSEDARWNGEQVEDEEVDDMDNDYCDTYFDNGEEDIDDFNVMRDEDEGGGGGKYYD